MKFTIRALFTVTLVLGTAVSFAACSGDDSAGPGPSNPPKTDSGTPDTGNNINDAGPDSSPQQCTTGSTFDNARIPGWPNNVSSP